MDSDGIPVPVGGGQGKASHSLMLRDTEEKRLDHLFMTKQHIVSILHLHFVSNPTPLMIIG